MKIKIHVPSLLLRRLVIAGLMWAIVLTTVVAPAESQCFLNIQGIKGNATEKFHQGWIEVRDYRHRISGLPAPSLLAKKAPRRTYARAGEGEFVLNKSIDSASSALRRTCASGTHIPQIKIEQRWVSRDKDVYMVYVFTKVTIVNVKPIGSDSGGESLEEVSFNYGSIEWEYTETKHGSGKPKGNVDTEWDLKQSEGG